MEEEMLRLLDLFKRSQIEFHLYEHEPVHTSIEAARVRGVELKSGVKALVLKKARLKEFFLADIAADRRIDLKKLATHVGARKIEFATRGEVMQKTKCELGSVHPFGKLFGMETWLDKSVLANDFVNFNIGMLTRSVRIRSADLLKLIDANAISDFSVQDLST